MLFKFIIQIQQNYFQILLVVTLEFNCSNKQSTFHLLKIKLKLPLVYKIQTIF